jgi:SAM-dependent methyltransferase
MTGQAGAMDEGRWSEVWANRQLDPSKGSVTAQLLAADGFDTGFGNVAEAHWTAYVDQWTAAMEITPETSVFEVGCGAGAFLYEMHRRGCHVGGIDQSSALIEIAKSVMPDGRFEVADAAELSLEPRTDIVVSSAVFLYFPSLEYASAVLRRMATRAERGVLILDLPDLARRDAAMAHRIATVGGQQAYEERYRGLDHLYFSRNWVEETLTSCGLVEVRTADQNLAGYANGEFRFNAWGFHPPAKGRGGTHRHQ